MKTVRLCKVCSGEYPPITYKNYEFLSQFITSKGMIKSSKATNLCYKHQCLLSINIKRARILGLLPFTTISQPIPPSELVKAFEEDRNGKEGSEQGESLEAEEEAENL